MNQIKNDLQRHQVPLLNITPKTPVLHRQTSKTAIILKFFIHKLDASLQITVHVQNFFKWKMKNKRKPKRANRVRPARLFVGARK